LNKDLLDHHAPIKRLKNKTRKTIIKPWITAGIKKSIKVPLNRTVKYGSQSIKSRCISDWNAAINDFLQQSPKRSSLCKKIRESFFLSYENN